MNNIHRRKFLQISKDVGVTMAAATSLFSNSSSAKAAPEKQNAAKIATFTESFQDRPVAEVCRLFKEIGLDGLDLTVRPGGHIHPDNVERELPAAVEAAHKHGVRILIVTSAISDVSDSAKKVFDTAGKLGIKYIRACCYRYQKLGSLRRELNDARDSIRRVADLADKYNVLPCIHPHSGSYIPSHGTILYELIRDIPPERIGVFADTMHMVLEGGADGWRQGLDLLAPWLALVAVKNFYWEKGHRDSKGQQRWRYKVCPIADGVSPIPEFINVLNQLDFKGVYSLKSEYTGSGSFKHLDSTACLKQTARDLASLKRCLQ
ncbi:MAG: sugar phosphate isomerase/epimerase [Pirellulales bacterium]|nr:sugar phosphate isomerase/epimerase [Pirellulales bacterium]